MSVIEVTAIPALSDNYIWLITTGGSSCAVVDPGDAQPVLNVLQEKGLDLAYILITHHHLDHIGGMRRLQELTGAEAFGPHDPRISGQTRRVAENESVRLPVWIPFPAIWARKSESIHSSGADRHPWLRPPENGNRACRQAPRPWP